MPGGLVSRLSSAACSVLLTMECGHRRSSGETEHLAAQLLLGR